MKSIKMIATYTSYLTGIAALAISLSCILAAYRFYTDGEEVSEILKKVSKRIRAGVILILITSVIGFLKQYYL